MLAHAPSGVLSSIDMPRRPLSAITHGTHTIPRFRLPEPAELTPFFGIQGPAARGSGQKIHAASLARQVPTPLAVLLGGSRHDAGQAEYPPFVPGANPADGSVAGVAGSNDARSVSAADGVAASGLAECAVF